LLYEDCRKINYKSSDILSRTIPKGDILRKLGPRVMGKHKNIFYIVTLINESW